MADVTIRITTDASGAVTGIQQVGSELGNLGAKGEAASSGMASFGQGILDGAKNLLGMSAALGGAAGIVNQVNELGVNSIRAKAGLDELTGGHADEWAAKMTTAVRGLVDDSDLMSKATFALSSGIVSTSGEMARLAQDGAALGRVFGGDAAGGIDSLTRALQMVGQTRGLRTLGVDVNAVKSEFEGLRATMGDEAAWKMAVMDQADASVKALGESAYGTGTALERVKIQLHNLAEAGAERVAIGIEATVNGSTAMFDYVVNGNTGQGNTRSVQAEMDAPGSNMVRQYHGVPLPGSVGTAGTAPAPSIDQVSAWQASNSRDALSRQTVNPDQDFGMTSNADAQARTAQNFANIRRVIEGANAPLQNFMSNTQRIHDMGQGISHWWSVTSASIQSSTAPLREQMEITRQRAAAEQQSVAARFGISGNNLASEVGGGLEGAIGARRQQIKDPKQQAAFDKESQTALDNYALATGNATKASLLFRDAQTDIYKKLTDGKISVTQASTQILGLERMLRDGATSADDMARAMTKLNIENAKGSQKTALRGADRADQAEANLNVAGGTPSDPYAGVKKSADEATSATAKIGPAAAAAGAQVAAAGLIMAGGMAIGGGAASAALGVISQLHSQLNAISRTWSVKVSVSGMSQN